MPTELDLLHVPRDEAAVLGACLVSPDARIEVSTFLKPQAFELTEHQRIYEAMLALDARRIHPSAEALAETTGLPLERLQALRSQKCPPTSIKLYAERLVQAHIRRQLYAAGERAMGYAVDPERTDPVADFMQALAQLDVATDHPIHHIGEVAEPLAEAYRETIETGIVTTCHTTGYPDLDEKMGGGYHDAELIIVAARPSMGKSTLMTSGGLRQAKAGVPQLMVTLEMSARQLAARILADAGGYSSNDARAGKLTKRDLPTIDHAVSRVRELPIWICDWPGITDAELTRVATKLKIQHDIQQVWIDYLQLMKGAGRFESREVEVAHISRQLKGLAKALDIPVVALAQLSRAVEKRGKEKKPNLSDLRESGALEQDADVVMFVYRAERYWPNDETVRGVFSLLIDKQRNGPAPTQVDLTFLHDIPAVVSRAHTHQQTQAPPAQARKAARLAAPPPPLFDPADGDRFWDQNDPLGGLEQGDDLPF